MFSAGVGRLGCGENAVKRETGGVALRQLEFPGAGRGRGIFAGTTIFRAFCRCRLAFRLKFRILCFQLWLNERQRNQTLRPPSNLLRNKLAMG